MSFANAILAFIMHCCAFALYVLLNLISAAWVNFSDQENCLEPIGNAKLKNSNKSSLVFGTRKPYIMCVWLSEILLSTIWSNLLLPLSPLYGLFFHS